MSAYAITFLILAGVLVWRLGSLLPGYSRHEVATYQASENLRTIWAHPFNAPYHILVRVLDFAFPHNYIAVHLASVFVGWLTLLLFCILVYRWYGTRTAIISTLIFGTSSWFLHTSRLGSPTVCFLAVVALVGCGVWLREHKAGLAVILGLFLATALLYTPGMAWFIAIGLLWQWKYVDKAFKQHLGFVTLGAVVFIAGLLPLGWKMYQTPSLIKTWLCLPANWNQPLHFIHNLIDIPLAIFVRGQTNPETWLGRMPLLSVFSIIAFILGSYVFYRQFKLARAKLFVGLAILGSVVIALSDGKIPLTALVPFVYVIVGVGASYLMGLWLDVFPRNPIARALGMSLFALVIGLACIYNMRSYFVAWPQASVTRAVFNLRP